MGSGCTWSSPHQFTSIVMHHSVRGVCCFGKDSRPWKRQDCVVCHLAAAGAGQGPRASPFIFVRLRTTVGNAAGRAPPAQRALAWPQIARRVHSAEHLEAHHSGSADAGPGSGKRRAVRYQAQVPPCDQPGVVLRLLRPSRAHRTSCTPVQGQGCYPLCNAPATRLQVLVALMTFLRCSAMQDP